MLQFHPGEAKVTNKHEMNHEKKPIKAFSPTTVLTWQNGPANRASTYKPQHWQQFALGTVIAVANYDIVFAAVSKHRTEKKTKGRFTRNVEMSIVWFASFKSFSELQNGPTGTERITFTISSKIKEER